MSKQKKQQHQTAGSDSTPIVRIDKWLWAARFFKTRSLASDAIKTGKVYSGSLRVKPSRDVHVGDEFTIKQFYWQKTIIVKALSGKRGPASQAVLLYEETDDSIKDRERLKFTKQAQPAFRDSGKGRPTKRERRHIISFTQK